MVPDKASLESVTGYLGVGALELFALALIVHGISGSPDLAETVASVDSQALLVLVPVLVVATILGLFTSLAVEHLLRLTPLLTPELFALVATSGNDAIIQLHAEVERHSRLLNGCLIAFILLGFSCLAETRHMGRLAGLGYLGAGICVVLAVLCPLVARQRQRHLRACVAAVCGSPKGA